jgi:hypothetical protein
MTYVDYRVKPDQNIFDVIDWINEYKLSKFPITRDQVETALMDSTSSLIDYPDVFRISLRDECAASMFYLMWGGK